jgi:hypothetical protein
MKLNQLKTVAFLVSTLVAGSAGAVEYTTNSPSFNADLSRVSSIIKPAASEAPLKPGASKADAQREELKALAKELESSVVATTKEKALLKENEDKNQTLDRLKAQTAQPKAIFAAEVEAEKRKNDELQKQFAQMNGQPSTPENPADLDMTGVDASCSKGVDLSQFQALANQMKNEPFSFLKREGAKMLGEKAKALTEKSFEAFFALLKATKEANAKKRAQEQTPEQNEFQKQLSELAKFSPDAKFDEEERLNGLRSQGKKLDQGIATWEDKLSDETEKLVKNLRGLGDDKAKVQVLATQFSDNLEQFRLASVKTAQDQAKKLYDNCRLLADKVGRDNPTAPNTLISTAYNMLVAFYNGDPTQYADGFRQALSSEVRTMQCRKASTQIEAQLGAAMQAKIKQVSSATDPNTLLQGALSTMTALGNAQAEVGRAFGPAKRSCNELAKVAKKIEGFAGNVQSQVASQQGQTAPGAAPATQQRNASALNGQVAGGRAVPAVHNAASARPRS